MPLARDCAPVTWCLASRERAHTTQSATAKELHAHTRGERAGHADGSQHAARQADAGVLATRGARLGDARRAARQSHSAAGRRPGALSTGVWRLGHGLALLRPPGRGPRLWKTGVRRSALSLSRLAL